MMATKNWFAHNGPDGSTPISRMAAAGVQAGYWGENIAAGQQDAGSVMTAWLNSPDHRANILGSHYTRIGIGVASSSSSTYGIYWVQDFADGGKSSLFTVPTITDLSGQPVSHAPARSELLLQGPALGTEGILYFPTAGCAPILSWTSTLTHFLVPNNWSFTKASEFELWEGRPSGGLGVGSAYYQSPSLFTIDTPAPGWEKDAALRAKNGG